MTVGSVAVEASEPGVREQAPVSESAGEQACAECTSSVGACATTSRVSALRPKRAAPGGGHRSPVASARRSLPSRRREAAGVGVLPHRGDERIGVDGAFLVANFLG